MKKMIAMAVLCVAGGAFATVANDAMTNDPHVVMTHLNVNQRYPWNGKVDIDFTFTSTIPEAFAFVQFKATYLNKVGETVEVPMKTFDQVSIPWCTNAGTYHVTWDAAADAPNLTVTNLQYTVTANMAKYMVIDLSKGTAATADDPYPITYLEECPDPTREDGGWTDEYKTTKMVFRLVQPGTCKIGWGTNAFTDWNCTPVKTVTFTRPFYLAIFECTQGQAKQVKGAYFGKESAEFKGSIRDKRPVSTASYNAWRGSASNGYYWPNTGSRVDPASFIGLLRTRTGNNEGFDMPTESEWEYAARAGGVLADAWGGDGLTTGQKGVNETGPTGNLTNTTLNVWGRYKFNGGYVDNGDGTYKAPAYTDEEHGTAVVGSYKPNAWGFYDMLGNARECSLDVFSSGRSSETVDPIGKSIPDTTTNTNALHRASKGGHWTSEAKYAALPFRNGSDNHKANQETQGCRIAWRFPFKGTDAE